VTLFSAICALIAAFCMPYLAFGLWGPEAGKHWAALGVFAWPFLGWACLRRAKSFSPLILLLSFGVAAFWSMQLTWLESVFVGKFPDLNVAQLGVTISIYAVSSVALLLVVGGSILAGRSRTK
jgi:hypothetical protein